MKGISFLWAHPKLRTENWYKLMVEIALIYFARIVRTHPMFNLLAEYASLYCAFILRTALVVQTYLSNYPRYSLSSAVLRQSSSDRSVVLWPATVKVTRLTALSDVLIFNEAPNCFTCGAAAVRSSRKEKEPHATAANLFLLQICWSDLIQSNKT